MTPSIVNASPNASLRYCEIGRCLLRVARVSCNFTHQSVCSIPGFSLRYECQPHEILFRENDPSENLFVLRRGLIKLTTVSIDGHAQIVGLAVPGQLVGFETKSKKARRFTAETVTPVTVCRLRNGDMLRVLKQNPPVAMAVIELVNHELLEAQQFIRMLRKRSAEKRVAWFLLSLASHAAPGATIPLALSRREIAELLGLTVETVSRLMSSFRRGGLIDAPRGGLRIRQAERLQACASKPERH